MSKRTDELIDELIDVGMDTPSLISACKDLRAEIERMERVVEAAVEYCAFDFPSMNYRYMVDHMAQACETKALVKQAYNKLDAAVRAYQEQEHKP